MKELAGPFKMSAPAISKDLKVLERAGLISRGREAQWRPCVLETKTLQEATDWMDQYRRFWEQSLDRLDAYLQELQAAEKAEEALRKSKKRKSKPEPASASQKRSKRARTK